MPLEKRKIPTTFTVDPDQLERLERLAARIPGKNRSVLAREGIDLILERYEHQEEPGQKVAYGETAERGGVPVEAHARRS